MSNGRLSTRESDNRELHSTVTSLIRTTNATDEMKISGVVVLDIVYFGYNKSWHFDQ